MTGIHNGLTLTKEDGMLKLPFKKSTKVEGARTLNQKISPRPIGFLVGMGVLCTSILTGPQVALPEGETSRTVTSSVLEVPSSDNEVKLTFTLYKVNHVQYFSAGVGAEERNASYPAYPLKLIFVQGVRAFLAGVTLSISQSDGTSLVDIPGEHVMGPWLFVDLPTGTYTITAADSRQRMVKKEVRGRGRGNQRGPFSLAGLIITIYFSFQKYPLFRNSPLSLSSSTFVF